MGRADAALYAYVDAAGTIHITDRLGDVPEPYQGMYRKEVAERARTQPSARAEKQAAGNAARAPVSPPGDANATAQADQQAAERARWQAEAGAWRARLKGSTEQLQAAEARATAANNPIFRELPGGRDKLARAQQEVAAARSEALMARQMLLEVLPKRARDSHVPPQWLLP